MVKDENLELIFYNTWKETAFMGLDEVLVFVPPQDLI